MHHLDANKTHGEKARWELQKNATCCFEQILPGINIPKNSNCTATYLPSQKPSKKGQENMQSTDGVRKNSYMMFTYESLHMDILLLADQQRLT